jgi:hypothetical protein
MWVIESLTGCIPCIAYYEARIAWDDSMIAAYAAGGDINALMATRPIYPTPTPPPRERL